jgi:hypothetical protein
MDRLEFVRVILSLVDIGTDDGRIGESEWVITLICEERRHAGGCVRSIVECELSKRKKLSPVILGIRTIHADVLFEGLIHAFSLTVSLGVMARRKMHGHVEKFTQCMEEGGNEVHASVGSDMGQNTVFGEDVDKEELSDLGRGDMSVAGE